MDPESDLLPITMKLPGSTITTARGQRVTDFLRKAELSPPQRIPNLAELPVLDCEPSLPSDTDAARSLLVKQRITEPGYRQPEQRTRHIFWTTRRRKSELDKDKWIFTKHEVAKALDGLLSRVPLVTPGIAQALLSHASAISLEELWCHLSDPKLEKRTASLLRRSRISLIPESPWLDRVTSQGNVEYIRLICHTGLGQDALDRAFNIALSKHSMDAMEVLLSFGATASACQDAIRERVRLDDIALARLLLSAPSAMSVEAWRYCMEPECESLQTSGKQSPAILLLCLTHRPDVVCGPLLITALRAQNFQATAIILAYAGAEHDFRDIQQLACEFASQVQNNGHRHKFFEILAESGLVEDSPLLRDELMKDVKTQQLQLVQLLADAGISLDTEPNNAVYWAVSHMNLDILGLFGNGNFSSPISLALNFAPDSASEPEMLRLVEILAPKGLAGKPLDLQLIRAARKQQLQLVNTLLHYGASVEFEQASAIQTALRNADFDIVSSLLRSECSPEVLSTTMSTAMTLQPRPSRLPAVKALVEKGVLNQELGVAIRRLVSEDGDMDSELIRFLLQHKAPVDKVDDGANNPVLVAVARGNLAVLKMLCDVEPRKETLSKAIPIAFGVINTWGYEVALPMIKLLLRKGAAGLPAHQTLLIAAKQDYRLEIVRLLVQHGADANYDTGASFAVALETANFKLLEILCLGCPPSQAILESVLFKAIDPRYYNLQALELLLRSNSSSAAALNILGASQTFRSNPNMTEMVPCFLQHGMDVGLGDGFLLHFAIQEKKPLLLLRILSTNPSITSLTRAFQAASCVQLKEFRLETMRLLLEQAKSAEIGQSRLIVQQTHTALAGDLASLQLLLYHKAVVDLDDGKAVQIAATSGSPEVLDLLLSSGPAPSTIYKACLAAASSPISWDQKQRALEHLLAANGGLPADEMSNLLADSVAKLPECTQLPQLLLIRGAKVQVETLKVAIETSSHHLFLALAGSIRSASKGARMFTHARKTTMLPTRRYWIYQHLLARDNSWIPIEGVSKALVDSLRAEDMGDFSVPKLLLEHGALVGYKNGASFSLALQKNSLEAVKLLSQYLVDDHMAGVIFDRARKTTLLERQVRNGVYRCLLQWNISKSSLYHALLDIIKCGHSDISVVQLLLAKGADPNEDEAHCFILASEAGAKLTFRTLSKHAKLSVVLKALVKHFGRVVEVVWWFNACLEEQPQPANIDQDELLLRCMRTFPRGTALLKLLLDHGLSTSTKASHRLCVGWQREPCTPLIWALFSSKPRIENDAILLLLKRGGIAALPAYSTPHTRVSAAFGCLLDKTRIPVLKALLGLDRVGVLDYKVPGSSLGCLGAQSQVSNKESSFLDASDELPLREASLYLGNFDAFRLLKGTETPNDTTLHLAALMTLPKFVKWLLAFHDPDHKAEDFDMMIPLALACESKPHPWCKIANEEADWKIRQKQTMKLLALRTSPEWRSRSRTVLHIALENGLDATEAMVEALGFCHDPDRNEKYIYVDKGGIKYSPQQYVMKFLDADMKEKNALVTCLIGGRCDHRPTKLLNVNVPWRNPAATSFRSHLYHPEAVILSADRSNNVGALD